VICGLPLYEYDHLLGWADVQRHVADEITLLCNTHHREKTSGLLPSEQITAANESPFNLREGVSKPYDLHYSGDQAEVVVGGNVFRTQDRGYGTLLLPLAVDGVPLIGFVLGDGHLLLNLNLFDESNRQILRIRNNQLFYVPDSWDIELRGRALIVREAARRILIDIRFEPPNRVEVSRGRLLHNGVEILVRPDHILVTNNATLVSGCVADGVAGGLLIGHGNPEVGGFFRIANLSRYQGDRSAAERWAREVMADDTGGHVS
jgi:trigger factor